MTIRTHWEAGTDRQRIVGFEVEPRSIAWGRTTTKYDPLDSQPKHYLKAGEQIKFSYSITTINDGTTLWANRMDHYYKIGNHDIHMADLLSCLGLVILLAGIVYCLIEVTVRRDVRSMGQLAIDLKLSKREKLNNTKKSLISTDQMEEENTGLVGSKNG